jgi:hypothetical protein
LFALPLNLGPWTFNPKPETRNPKRMPALENAQHEAFAQARFDGKTLTESHYAAGYAGDKATASRLGKLPGIQERVAELYRERATATAYEKTNAVRDLLAVIHTPPSDAGDDTPLCEVHMGKDGPYHRLPGKLQAMSRLIKLMGWDEPVELKVQLKDNFLEALIRARRHPAASSLAGSATCLSGGGREPMDGVIDSKPTSCSDSSPPPLEDPELVEGLTPSPISSQPSAFPSQPLQLPPRHEPSGANRVERDSLTQSARRATPAGVGKQIAAGDPKGEGGGLSQSPTDKAPLSARHEQFALARVRGLSVLAAYHAAGYTGDTPNLAWRLNSMPAVQSRIAELNGGVADAVGYQRDDAVRDLILIIRATPAEVGPDHPYCEKRVTSWGTYHRFPSKLVALTLLARMLGWNGPTKVEVAHDPDKGFKQLQEFVSRRS